MLAVLLQSTGSGGTQILPPVFQQDTHIHGLHALPYFWLL